MIIMTSFAKKVTKAVKHTDNCVVLGRAFGNFDEIVETFKTVFVLSDENNEVKGRNIVYRESFDDVSILPHINAIFIDEDQLDNMVKIENLIQQRQLVIYIGADDYIHASYGKFLGSKKYEVVDIVKNYQIWKPKK